MGGFPAKIDQSLVFPLCCVGRHQGHNWRLSPTRKRHYGPGNEVEILWQALPSLFATTRGLSKNATRKQKQRSIQPNVFSIKAPAEEADIEDVLGWRLELAVRCIDSKSC